MSSAGERGSVVTVQEEGSRARLRRSSVPTFEAFYAEHWPTTVTVTGALCRNAAVAEELAQEAFLRAYRRWHRVSALERPELWVRRVALNLAVSRFRRLQAEARALGRVRAGQRSGTRTASTPEVEEFWTALRSLPARQAQVAALFYVDDLSVVRIADLLGCAEGTVKAHLHAARKRLRAALDHPSEDDV